MGRCIDKWGILNNCSFPYGLDYTGTISGKSTRIMKDRKKSTDTYVLMIIFIETV